MTDKNYFTELNRVDCSKDVEKKNGFSYLSWPFAIAELLKRHPEAAWKVYESADGWPYFKTDSGCYVKLGVTVNAIERIQWHPVLDHRNKTVVTPDAFQVNTSIQRGLVKAIALHGLGLFLYAGEDLPEGAEHAPIHPASDVQESLSDKEVEILENHATEIRNMLRELGPMVGPGNAMAYIESIQLEPEAKITLWQMFDAPTRAALKKAHK